MSKRLQSWVTEEDESRNIYKVGLLKKMKVETFTESKYISGSSFKILYA